MSPMATPRFRAKVYAYQRYRDRWSWGYTVFDMRPLRPDWKPGHPIAGLGLLDSQPEALRGALATLRNLGPAHRCHAADTCTLDPACPFSRDCQRIEAS